MLQTDTFFDTINGCVWIFLQIKFATSLLASHAGDKCFELVFQVKSMLEYMLWGPSDITMSQSREQGLQRWLDLERATVLNNLIRTQGLWNIELTIFEEYHLLFLVQTCAKMLHEASLLFESEVACM